MTLMAHPFRSSLVCLFFAAFLCASPPLRSQTVEVFDNIDQLKARIERAGDTTILLNFWATWCAPCVAELPYFDQLRDYYGGQNVQILLVSLNFKSDIESKVIPFLQRQRTKSEIGLMADQDLNAWIPLIYDPWDGAIPATLVLQGDNYAFKEGEFESLTELDTFARPLILDSAAYVGKKMPGTDLGNGKK